MDRLRSPSLLSCGLSQNRSELGHLLAARSGADIRYIDPQQTVVSKLIVVANDPVERMTVALNPSQGQAPASQSFGAAGGQVDLVTGSDALPERSAVAESLRVLEAA